MTTTCSQHEWKSPDGEAFSYSLWAADVPPGQAPRAVVVAVHGLSGAALDYEPLGSHLARHGVATYALELRGQGNDPVPQRRGDLEQIGDWFADLSAFFALVRGLQPGARFYYYGESMGADGKTTFEFEPRAEGAKGRKPFVKKEPAGGTTQNGHVLATNVIKAKGGARKRAAKKVQ